MKLSKIFLVLGFLFFVGGSFVLAQEEKSGLVTALSSIGTSSPSDFSWVNLIGSVIFGGIGFVAFIYGKKQSSYKPLFIGIVLMAYPYFLKSIFWMYTVGIVLCLLLFFWRD